MPDRYQSPAGRRLAVDGVEALAAVFAVALRAPGPWVTGVATGGRNTICTANALSTFRNCATLTALESRSMRATRVWPTPSNAPSWAWLSPRTLRSARRWLASWPGDWMG